MHALLVVPQAAEKKVTCNMLLYKYSHCKVRKVWRWTPFQVVVGLSRKPQQVLHSSSGWQGQHRKSPTLAYPLDPCILEGLLSI